MEDIKEGDIIIEKQTNNKVHTIVPINRGNYLLMIRYVKNWFGDKGIKPKDDISLNKDGLKEDDHDSFNEYTSLVPIRSSNYLLKDLDNLYDPLAIINKLEKEKHDFEKLLKSQPTLYEIQKIFSILNRLYSSVYIKHLLEILSRTLETDFIEHLEDTLRRLDANICLEKPEFKEFFETFIDNVTKYFEIIVELMPTLVQENFKKLIISFLELLKRLIASSHDDSDEFLIDFSERITILNKRLNETWKDDILFVYPLGFMSRGHVNKNIIYGPYKDVKHYIDTQFRLLKEDFEESLRSGLTLYKDQNKFGLENKKNAEVDVYKNVTIKVTQSLRNNGYIVTFQDTSRIKNIDWTKSSSFMCGSLVLLSNDNFHSFYFALVKSRHALEKGQNHIRISFIDKPPSSLKNCSFVLLESTNFFEPYFQVMNALLNMSEKNFPMYKYIINADTKAKLPAYVNPNIVYEICGKQIKICDKNDWPSADKLNLNDSQMHALRIALTSELTLIQGPPGTGKTFLCLKIIETLLNNIIPCRGFQPSPILVVCYKNHALDQILGNLLERNVKVLRLGGQSKIVELKETYNINAICRKTKVYGIRSILRKLKDLNNNMCTTQQKIIKYYQQKSHLEDRRGIVSLNVIQCIMKPSIFDPLNKNNRFIKWLLSDIANEIDIDHIIELCESHKQRILKGDLFVVNCPPLPENGLNFDILNECDNFNESVPEVSYSLSLYNLETTMKVLREYIYFLSNNQLEINHLDEIISQVKIFKDCLTIYKHLKQRLNSNAISASSDDLNSMDDIDKLNTEQRWLLFNYWKDKYNNFCEQQINQLQKKHDDLKTKFDEINDIKKVKKIEKFGAQVIGATTTGAARCRHLLAELKPKIVIIEEAAEVLEAHAVVSISKHCQHLILIGDHKQLRPNPSSYRLAQNFHLNVSLFERMIMNNLYAPVLTLQHRMRPEIAALITPSVYEKLENHYTVLNYPNVMGVAKNLFFINHQIPEDEITNSLSKMNKFEGDLLIKLCTYLLHNGYLPEEITILSTYVAQNEYITAEYVKLGLPPGVRITVVDNFQGEENRIILLSLVRCNEKSSIGFLSIENRVCVALSRAKEGFFIIGNMASLMSKSNLWAQVNSELMKSDSIGKSLPLICKAHQMITEISSAEDISKVLDKGCGKVCDIRISCGHICARKCHVIDFDHKKEYRCLADCYRKCENGHTCKARCGDVCPPCKELVDHIFECGHRTQIPCHQITELSSEEETDTLDECTKALRQLTLSDSKEDDNTQQIYEIPRCKERCNFLLSCGHNCSRKCHKDDREHAEYICEEICNSVNINCPVGHKCKKKCSVICGDCLRPVKKKLSCGHTVNTKCYVKPEDIKCTEKCTKTLNCGHRCKLKCALPCGKCQTLVEKVIEKCKHKIKVKCSEAKLQNSCNETCGLKLKCGHNCKGKCSAPCGTYVCKEFVSKISPACGHKCKIPCHLIQKTGEMNWKDIFSSHCTVPCKSLLKCGHTCTGTCGECVNGRLHKKCTQKCSLKMICGHNCSSSCGDIVHLCNKSCQRICEHIKCQGNCSISCKKKCQRRCNRNCVHFRCKKNCWEECNQKCTRVCPFKLKCGHPCRGICGQKCPGVCLECGTLPSGDDQLSRYIILKDCGHTINIKSINAVINSNESVKNISVLKCPKCNCPVIKTFYFKEEVNRILSKITTIKSIITENIINEDLRRKFSNMIQSLQQEVTNIGAYPEANKLMITIKQSAIPFIIGANKNENYNKILTLFFIINYVTLLIKHYKRIIQNNLPKFERKLIKIRFDLLLNKITKRLFDLSLEQMFQFKIELIKLILIIDMYCDIIDKCVEQMKTFEQVKQLLNYKDDFNDTIYSESNVNNNNRKSIEYELIVNNKTEIKLSFPAELHSRTMHFGDWLICDKEHIFNKSSFNDCPQCKGIDQTNL